MRPKRSSNFFKDKRGVIESKTVTHSLYSSAFSYLRKCQPLLELFPSQSRATQTSIWIRYRDILLQMQCFLQKVLYFMEKCQHLPKYPTWAIKRNRMIRGWLIYRGSQGTIALNGGCVRRKWFPPWDNALHRFIVLSPQLDFHGWTCDSDVCFHLEEFLFYFLSGPPHRLETRHVDQVILHHHQS